MTKIRTLQLYRGTEAQNDAYTGSIGELTMDTTNNEVRIHDGSTAGGHTLAKKASIPTVNNATITVTQGGVTKGTFTTNQSSASTIALDAGGDSNKSVDADIVGTLTIASNGQVSGFNSSNYLRVPSSISFDNTASFEIDCAVSVSGLPITENYIFEDGNTNGLKIIVVNNNGCKLRIRANNTTIIDGTTELNLNTKYFIKFECDGINYTLSISTDGITYTQDGTATAMSFQETRYLIGYQGMYLTAYMNDYYIKQNGILVWSGLDAAGLHQRVAKGHEVIEFQEPTAANNYTWYRKYADGWVEQGGQFAKTGGQNSLNEQTLSIPMANTAYYANVIYGSSGPDNTVDFGIVRTTTTLKIYPYWSSTGQICPWYVCGMAAN